MWKKQHGAWLFRAQSWLLRENWLVLCSRYMGLFSSQSISHASFHLVLPTAQLGHWGFIYELKSHNLNPGFLIPHLCLFLNTLWDSIKRKETDRQGKPSTVHRSQGLTDVFFLMELWVGKGVDSKSKIRETLPWWEWEWEGGRAHRLESEMLPSARSGQGDSSFLGGRLSWVQILVLSQLCIIGKVMEFLVASVLSCIK
jgi:hypothetical protein